jgi:tetratricopeptide (TPR) repeat protein
MKSEDPRAYILGEAIVRRSRKVLILVWSILLLTAVGAAPKDDPYDEFCQRGRQFFDQKRYREAATAYTEAIQREPKRPYAYVGRAMAYISSRQYEYAIADCTKAIDLTDGEVVPYLSRGDAHRGAGQLDLAINDYTKAIDGDRKRPDGYFKRAEAFLDKADYDRALRDYAQSLDLKPDDANAHRGRALAYQGRGDIHRAIQEFTEAIRCAPKVAQHYFLRAQAERDRRNYDRVIADCSEAILCDTGFAAAFGLRATAYLEKKDFKRAFADLDEAVRLAPMDAGAFFWLGKAYHQFGDWERAIKELSEAIRHDPTYIAAYRARAVAYDRVGKLDDAKSDRIKADELASKPTKSGTLLPPIPLSPDAVRKLADEERDKARQLQKEVEDCEAHAIVPEHCADADELFDRSLTLLDTGSCEVAASGFRQAQQRYKMALAAFEDVAAKTPSLWLDWAVECMQRDAPSADKVWGWITVAEAGYLIGDRDASRAAMQRAFTLLKGKGLTNPYDAIDGLLDCARIQTEYNDGSGAKSSALEAAFLSQGIDNVSDKSVRLAHCAGILARLGEQQEWTKHIQLALEAAGRLDSPGSHGRACQTPYVKCIAYAEARSPARALTFARQIERAMPNPDRRRLASWAAPAHACVALAAAANKHSDGISSKEFPRAYTAACAHIACLSDRSRESLDCARLLLAGADAELGNTERAWVSAANLRNPATRAWAVAWIVRAEVERGRYDAAVKWGESMSHNAHLTNAFLWIGQAQVHRRRESMPQLKHWAQQDRTAAESATALAGIAAGVSAAIKGQAASGHTVMSVSESTAAQGNEVEPSIEQMRAYVDKGDYLAVSDAFAAMLEQNRSNPQVREFFDKTAARVPDWWLEEAAALATKVEDPTVRARLLLHLAYTYRESGNDASCRVSLTEAVHCSREVWQRIFERRSGARRGSSGGYLRKAEKRELNAFLHVLMDVERFQHEIGDSAMSFDTLLLALRCTECMPRDGELSPWLAPIAGRVRLRGRADIADIILAGGIWPYERRYDDTKPFLVAWAAAEAGDMAEVETIANRIRRAPFASRTSPARASLLYAKLSLNAARKGDEDAYRRAAMTAGGLLDYDQQSAPAALLLLAEAAVLRGQPDAALEYLRPFPVRSPEHDMVHARIIAAMPKQGRVVEARKLLGQISDEGAAVAAWYATTKAEASAPSARLSAVYEEINALRGPAKKAAALAGVATALLAK